MNRSQPDDEEAARKRQKLHDDLDFLSKSARQAILELGPGHMQSDWTNIGMALRRRRAVIQAQYAALTGTPARLPAPAVYVQGNVVPPPAVAAIAAPTPPQPPVVAAQGENDQDGDDDAANGDDDGDATIRSADAGWADVPPFEEGIGKVNVFHRLMGVQAEYQKKIGELRLQVNDETKTRRLIMRNGPYLQLNIKAPATHTFEMQKKGNKEFGNILFFGIDGAADPERGQEMFAIKCALARAQQLSSELGGRSN